MINSPKNVLGRKQFNTQSSATPNKKIANSSIHYSNQKSMSFQNGSAGVSYAQLQIILQNVHKIKKKASDQMNSLETKCHKQDQELKVLREQIKRYENFEETIKQEKTAIQIKYEAQLSVLSQDIQESKENARKLAKNLSQIKQELSQKQSQIEQLNERLVNCDRKCQFWQHKYHDLTNILQINQLSHQIKVIKQQYTDIPHLMKFLTSSLSSIQHQTKTIQDLKKSIQESKNQISHNNKIIDTITDENRHLLLVIEGLNKEKENLTADLTFSQNEKASMMKQRDNTMVEVEDQIQSIKKKNEERISEKENIINSLKNEIKSLENKLIQAADRQRQSRQQSQFKSMVDEVCDQYADYENVMKRIQYLEKYRSQYYFNIEKIQYLCRILDS